MRSIFLASRIFDLMFLRTVSAAASSLSSRWME